MHGLWCVVGYSAWVMVCGREVSLQCMGYGVWQGGVSTVHGWCVAGR